MTASIHSRLKDVIADVIWASDPDKVLTPDKVDGLIELYSDFIVKCAAKYVAGQKEHGGNLSDRDCASELYKELVDSVHYIHEVMKKAKAQPSSL